MRKPRYLSPSGIKCWDEDSTRETFYIRYLADVSPPRFPQTKPMAVGSSFDAFVKAYLAKELFGGRTGYSFKELFESQVEPQNRDAALKAGAECFAVYKETGALADLMIELDNALEEPRFEFKVEHQIRYEVTVDGPGILITLLGIPDVFYISRHRKRVIHDFKVNGYYSKASPCKGYINLRPGGLQHKACILIEEHGMKINSVNLEELHKEWATQLAVYSWLMGNAVGDYVVGSIDQIACGPNGMRVAQIRSRIGEVFQKGLMNHIAEIWGHIQGDFSPIIEPARQSVLDKLHAVEGMGWTEKSSTSY